MAMLEILRTAVGPDGDVFAPDWWSHRAPRQSEDERPKAGARLRGQGAARRALGRPKRRDPRRRKRYHTNASGRWRKEVLPLEDDLSALNSVWAPSDDDVWVGSEDGEVLHLVNGEWISVDIGIPKDGNVIYAIRGLRSGVVYVASDNGVAFFDGKKWQKAKMPGTDCIFLDVLPRENEPCLVVGRDGPNLFAGKGTRWTSIEGLTKDPNEDFTCLAERGGSVFIATGDRLLEWDGRKARDAIPAAAEDEPYLGILSCASNGEVLVASTDHGVYVSTGKA